MEPYDKYLSAKFFQQLPKIFQKDSKNFMKITLKFKKKKLKIFKPYDFAASPTPTPAPLLERSTFTNERESRKTQMKKVCRPVTCCFGLQIPLDGPDCMSKDG